MICTPETNIIFYVNYTWKMIIKNKLKSKIKKFLGMLTYFRIQKNALGVLQCRRSTLTEMKSGQNKLIFGDSVRFLPYR